MMSIRLLPIALAMMAAMVALAAGPAAASPARASGPAALAASRPNVIFILVDDLRYDALGVLDRRLKTPNLDRLAREGVRYENAFVTTALCSPSRATILTGRSTRNHRVVGNEEPEPPNTVFFPAYLQQAGYSTAMIGKWHMGVGDEPRPGFDHWVSFPGQGVYLPSQAAGGVQMMNINGRKVAQKGYVTDELTDYALEWMDAQRGTGKPYFLYLSHKAVHEEFTPAQRHKGQYADLQVTPPASQADTPENYEGKPRWVRTQRNSWHGVDYAYYGARSLEEEQRLYYGSLTAVDESVGRLLTYLRRTGQERNTVIFFMGDNGFLFGEHGLIDKRNAYEESMRVPLLAWGPGRLPRGRIVKEMALNLDVAPTVLDLAGAAKPPQFEGHSLLPPTLGQAGGSWRKDFAYEYYWEFALPHTPTTFALRTERFKYIYYHGVWEPEELYDLREDPGEMRNLALEPAHAALKAELRARLFAELRNQGGELVVPFAAKNRDGRIYRSVSGAGQGDFPKDWTRGPRATPLDRGAPR